MAGYKILSIDMTDEKGSVTAGVEWFNDFEGSHVTEYRRHKGSWNNSTHKTHPKQVTAMLRKIDKRIEGHTCEHRSWVLTKDNKPPLGEYCIVRYLGTQRPARYMYHHGEFVWMMPEFKYRSIRDKANTVTEWTKFNFGEGK